mgnify:CR=1 FL=1
MGTSANKIEKLQNLLEIWRQTVTASQLRVSTQVVLWHAKWVANIMPQLELIDPSTDTFKPKKMMFLEQTKGDVIHAGGVRSKKRAKGNAYMLHFKSLWCNHSVFGWMHLGEWRIDDASSIVNVKKRLVSWTWRPKIQRFRYKEKRKILDKKKRYRWRDSTRECS